MFIKKIQMAHILPCIADPDKIRFTAYLEKDVSELLPYLNAAIKGGIYNHQGQTLTIRKEGRLITIHAHKIAAGKILNRKDAEKVLEWLREFINHCFAHKSKIEPNFERRQKLNALDIYKLLPGTNCHKCNELTCLAYAVKLSDEIISVMKCKMIFQSEYMEKRKELIRVLKSAGYEVPEVFSHF